MGWIGTSATTIVDYMVRPAEGRGEHPDKKLRDIFLVGNFVESLPAGSSRYVTELYEQAKEIEQAYNSHRAAMKSGDIEKANEIRNTEGEKLLKYRQIENIKKQVAKINTQIKRIESNRLLTGDLKRQKIDALEIQRDRLARNLSPSHGRLGS